MTVFLAWLYIWWTPIAGALVLTFLFVYIHLSTKAQMRWQNLPENVLARQKADYDRAHAYTEGKCPVRD